MEQTYNLLAIVILGLILEIIIAYKLKSDKKRLEKFDEQYKKEFELIKQQLTKIVTATRDESQEIVSKILEEYRDVHSEVKNFTLKLQQKIEDITQEIIEEQKNLLAEQTQKATTDLTNTTQAEVSGLGKMIQSSIAEIQQKISTQLLLESQTAHREIDSFKKDQIKKIAKESEQLVNLVSKKYLGKMLSTADKHELTLQLVNEIWQEKTLKNDQK
jgi:F0F1-type ATP synthase membrane subunit b/b'